MKILAALFSIYFLSLMIVPCADGFSSHTPENMVVSFEDGHQHTTNDLCTPFCQCQCCQSLIVMHNISQFAAPDSNFYAPIIFRPHDLKKEFPTSLFQPPQV